MNEDAVTAADELDDLLAKLQGGKLSPLELRVLLELAERDASPSNLADVLDTELKAIGRATRRLAMRGLIGRRFDERGRDSHFELSIRREGLLELAPWAERAAGGHRPAKTESGGARDAPARCGTSATAFADHPRDPAEGAPRHPRGDLGRPRDDRPERRDLATNVYDGTERGRSRVVGGRADRPQSH